MIMLLLSPLFVETAQAAVTGAVRGHVEDESGLAVPGATVTLSGREISGEMSATTDDDGNFRFPSVPVGTHTLKVTTPGLQPIETKVTVRLDETAFMPVVLKVSGSADVEVIAVQPVIDSTRSSFSTELSSETLHDLPTGRSYQAAVNMLPGVSGRVDTSNGGPGDGNPSVRGEGKYGNNIEIDGISTRDPATKTFSVNLPFEAIDDIQVYTDGAPAEFGEFTGMLVNVVTKDGGDEHFGSAYYGISMDASGSPTYKIADLSTHEEVDTPKRDFLHNEVSLAAGGPIVKEKLWYFVGVGFNYDTDTFEGSDVASTDTAMNGFGQLTYFVNPDLRISYKVAGSFDINPNHETSSQYTESSQTDYKSSDLTHLLRMRWSPDANTELEIKGAWLNSSIDVVPSSGSEDDVQIHNIDTDQYTGNSDSFDYNDRGRLGGGFSLTHLLDGTTGHHKVKLGGEYWSLTDTRQLVFTGPGEGLTYDSSPEGTTDAFGNPVNGLPCTAPDYADCYGYTEYKDVGPLGHTGRVFSAYLQDDWQPAERLSLNLGVRADQETLYQNAGEELLSSWMISPRTGLAWDITGDSKTKLTANFGRYYDVMGNAMADWGDTRSAYSYREYQYNAQSGGYDLVWVQDPAGNPATFDDKLKPFHLDKVALGFEREIFNNFSVGIRGMVSKTSNLAEDVDADGSAFEITNPQAKWRDYRALELTINKKLSDHWQALASYTLSESKGHTPGQFEIASGGQTGSDGNGVGVYLDDVNDMDAREGFFDDGTGWLLEGLAGLGTETDDAGYYGYLPYHSFHQVKVNGSYTFEVKKLDLTAGLVYEFNSGNAWQKRGMVSLYGDYFAFPEGRGTRFMPAVHYVDLRVAAAYDLGNERSVELALNVFNLLDLAQSVTYVENEGENFGLTLYRQAPRAIQASLQFDY